MEVARQDERAREYGVLQVQCTSRPWQLAALEAMFSQCRDHADNSVAGRIQEKSLSIFCSLSDVCIKQLEPYFVAA